MTSTENWAKDLGRLSSIEIVKIAALVAGQDITDAIISFLNRKFPIDVDQYHVEELMFAAYDLKEIVKRGKGIRFIRESVVAAGSGGRVFNSAYEGKSFKWLIKAVHEATVNQSVEVGALSEPSPPIRPSSRNRGLGGVLILSPKAKITRYILSGEQTSDGNARLEAIEALSKRMRLRSAKASKKVKAKGQKKASHARPRGSKAGLVKRGAEK